MKTKYTLPKPYLSYSALDLWYKNKNAYRDRYYLNLKAPQTQYTLFGSEIHSKIANEPSLSHIPRLKRFEEEIKTKIDDIPIRSFLDIFDPESLSFLEYKTGIKKPNGEYRWTMDDVKKHKQLPFYALMILNKYGDVNLETSLIFLETKMDINSKKYGNTEIIYSSNLGLTGFLSVFPRKILKKEIKEIKKWIISGAEEISEDYKLWKKK